MKRVPLITLVLVCVLASLQAQKSSLSAEVGHSYMSNGDFEQAQEVYFNLSRKSQDPDSVLYYRTFFLDALSRAGEKDKVDSLISKYDAFAKENPISPDVQSLYMTRKGWIQFRSQAHTKALELADSALQYARSKLSKGLAYSLKGTLLSVMDNQKSGLEVLLQAKRLLEESGHKGKDYGVTLMNIGNAYAAKNDNLQSRDYFFNACEILMDYYGEKHPDYYIIKLFYSRELTQRNEFDEANDLLLSCLSHFKEKEDINSIIHCYHNLTDNSLKAGDLEKALNYLEINIGISKEHGSDTTYNHAVLLNSAINCLRDLNRPKEAWKRLEDLASLCHQYPDINQWLYKDVLSDKALLLSDQSRYNEADSIYAEVEKYLLKNYGRQSEPMAVHYFERADNYLANGNYKEALRYHKQAAQFYQNNYDSLNPSNINMLLQKGRIYEAMGDLKRAGYTYLNAKKKFDKTFGNIPSDPDKSQDFQSAVGRDNVFVALLRVTATRSSQGDLSDEWFEMAVGWLNEAKVYYYFLVSELFQVENSDHLIQQFHNIGSYGQLLYYQKYQQENKEELLYEALSLAEMTKNYARRIILNDKEARKYANIPDSLIKVDRAFNKQIQYYETFLTETYNEDLVYRLNALRNERHQFISFLEKEYPDYYEMKYDPYTASGRDIQIYAQDQGMDIVYYFMGIDHIFSYLINENGIHLNIAEHSGQLDSLVLNFKASMEKSNARSFFETGGELFRILLSGHVDMFTGNKVCIVPDKSLGYLSFETLPMPTNDDVYSFKDIHYLIEDHNILYRYELTSAVDKRTDTENRTNELRKGLVFVPVFEGQQDEGSHIIPLPWSKSLGEYLDRHKNMYVYQGPDATKSNFLNNSKGSDLLHFSTHAFTNDAAPMQSYLLFAGLDQQLDSLTALEVIQNDLDANLALLSACQTGMSEYKVGFGLQSLSWSFEYAGCKNFLVSLWSIDDEASTELLKNFYENLEEGNSVTEALRASKLKMLEKGGVQTSNPYYWAGMIYIGNDTQLQIAEAPGFWNGTIMYVILSLVVLLGIYYIIKRRVNA